MDVTWPIDCFPRAQTYVNAEGNQGNARWLMTIAAQNRASAKSREQPRPGELHSTAAADARLS
eukprot:3889151-Rhodomonas_salina.1